jgi:hypothetical protein
MRARFGSMKSCIFCGNSADSKENLFPRWILKRVVTRQPLYRQLGDSPPEITEDQEVRLPCVCQKWNNTWMSRMTMRPGSSNAAGGQKKLWLAPPYTSGVCRDWIMKEKGFHGSFCCRVDARPRRQNRNSR